MSQKCVLDDARKRKSRKEGGEPKWRFQPGCWFPLHQREQRPGMIDLLGLVTNGKAFELSFELRDWADQCRVVNVPS